MDPSPHVVVLFVLGLIIINAGVAFAMCAREVPAWIRNRRACRIEAAFDSGSFTVPTSWVREARRHR